MAGTEALDGSGAHLALRATRAVILAVVQAIVWWPSFHSIAAAANQPAETESAVKTVAGKISFTRLYIGQDGASHFASEELVLTPIPGAGGLEAALAVNRIGDSRGVLFAQLKAGATEDWHIAPRRQLMVCVRGVVEITASDGEKRRITPGQFVLLEDTSGKGHITHSVGPDDHVALAIPVSDGVLTKH